MAKCQIIVNRQKAAFNRKHRHLPEEPTLSIHTGSQVEYAFAVELSGTWVLKQDYDNSPCSGAHIWLEGDRDNLRITAERPLSESAVDRDALVEDLSPKPTLPKEFF